jgi:hypothetical protein
MESSCKFGGIVDALQTGAFLVSCKVLVQHTLFAMKQAAKMTHHVLYQYNINKTMHHKLDFFRDKLKPDLGIDWVTSIAHLIPCAPFAMMVGNSSLDGARGFSIAFRFWWHLRFSDKVIQRMLDFKRENADGKLILINILEFVTVIINNCAALQVIKTTPVMEDPYPVLLNITDNMSTSIWTVHMCKHSKLGCLLACFFCSLLINLPLGIILQWISTKENIIADYISCMKKESTSNSLPAFNFSTLKQSYPKPKHCFFFQIQPELISLIWEIVLTKK